MIVNGITADEWVTIKSVDPAKAEDIVALFSDVVFEGIMRKTNFLEFYSKAQILAYQCLKEKIVVVGLKSKSDKVDLTQYDLAKGQSLMPQGAIEIFHGEKEYRKSREEDIFQLTNSGFQISDGQLFKNISLAMVD